MDLKDLPVKLELNVSENVILCYGDTTETSKFLDNSLECGTRIEKRYATMIDEFCAGTTLIPYSKVISVHYQRLSKDRTTWKDDGSNLFVRSLQGLRLLFIEKSDHFANKNEEFYNPTIKKVLTTINGMPHQLFAACIKAGEIYP